MTALRMLLCAPLVLAAGCTKATPERDPEPRIEAEPTPDPEPTPKDPEPETAPDAKPKDRGDNKGGLAAMTRNLVDGIEAQDTDALGYIPSRATILAQVYPAKLFEVPGVRSFLDEIFAKRSGDIRGSVEVMEACGIELAQIESITFAMDEHDDGALVVEGPSLGKADTWRCIKTESASRGDGLDYEIREEGGKTVMIDGEDQGRFVDDDTFVFFDGKWTSDVEHLIDGTSKSSVDTGGLADTLARVKTDEPMWFAALLPPEALRDLDGSPVDGIDEVWGALSIGTDHVLDLTVAGKAPSDTEAGKMRDAVQKSWDEAKPMGATFGIPQKLIDSIAFKADGDVASFHMQATMDDIEVVREKLMSGF